MEDEYCLSNLLEELLGEYKQHHRQLVAGQQRLSFELNTLLESSEYGDIDVHCSPSSDSVSVGLEGVCGLCVYQILSLYTAWHQLRDQVLHFSLPGLFCHPCLLHQGTFKLLVCNSS